MASVNVIFHSVSGHTFRLAEAIAEGVAEVPRCQAKLLLIGEPNGAKPITMPGLAVNIVMLAFFACRSIVMRLTDASFSFFLMYSRSL